jgi:hypothetical protein
LKAFFLRSRVPSEDDLKQIIIDVYGERPDDEIKYKIIVAKKRFSEFRSAFKKDVMKLTKEYSEGYNIKI